MWEVKKQEIYKQLENIRTMVVATAANHDVTARTLSVIWYKEKLYFQTDTKFLTIQQLQKNKQIALCYEHIQMEGIAKILGPTMEQIQIKDVYQSRHQKSYQSYSHLPTSVMVEVTIQKITLWQYRGQHSYQCWYDLEKEDYTEKQYV